MESAKSIGTILKEARIAKGISLLDAEKATSIRVRYLEAVENDEYNKTPGEVFLKGIIRNYGNYLGLDGLALVNMYKKVKHGETKEAAPLMGIREVDKVKLNIQLKEKRDIGSGTGKIEFSDLPIKQIAAGLAAVVVLTIGYFTVPLAIDFFKSPSNTDNTVVVKEEKLPTNTSTIPAPITDKVQVDMEALSAECWLEVTSDGEEIFAGMLKEKEKRTFTAKEKLIVKYGNIGVMQLVVNGVPIDLQGEHGVAVKTYTRGNVNESNEVVSEAVPIAQETVPAAEEPKEHVVKKEAVISEAEKAPVVENKEKKYKENKKTKTNKENKNKSGDN